MTEWWPCPDGSEIDDAGKLLQGPCRIARWRVGIVGGAVRCRCVGSGEHQDCVEVVIGRVVTVIDVSQQLLRPDLASDIGRHVIDGGLVREDWLHISDGSYVIRLV